MPMDAPGREEGQETRRRADSDSLVHWVYWMVCDMLASGAWRISYGFPYYDKRKKNIVLLKHAAAPERIGNRFETVDACALFEEKKIVIARDAEEKTLCLFHECLEVLFSDWKDNYFMPRAWGLECDDDPIVYLEAATWEKLTDAEKSAIAAFLPA